MAPISFFLSFQGFSSRLKVFSLVSRFFLSSQEKSLVSRSDDKIFAVVFGWRQKHHLVGERIADAPFEHEPTEAP